MLEWGHQLSLYPQSRGFIIYRLPHPPEFTWALFAIWNVVVYSMRCTSLPYKGLESDMRGGGGTEP